MTLLFADRVQETTVTTGTGTLTLAGASAQSQAFSAGIGSGNTTYYCLLSGDGVNWETGVGTIAGAGPFTLARTLISSSTGSLIALTGTSVVFCDLPASKLPATTTQLGQTATGTNQATAFLISANVTTFTTVAAATGAVLPTLVAGNQYKILNRGASALLVYPPSGAQIEALGNNNPATILVGGVAVFLAETSTLVYAS